MDAFGHVNNAMYSTYFEQVRVDWLPGMNDLYTQGHGTIVWFDPAAGHSVAIPDAVYRQLEESC